VTAKITIRISREDLKNIITSAVESSYGICYWAQVRQYDCDRGTALIRERDVPKAPWLRLNCAAVARGLQLCSEMPADEGGWAFTEWLRDRAGDAPMADNIVQFGVLGALKYG